MANPEITKLSPHELELHSTDADNVPYIKIRGMLYWTGAAWAKWTGDITIAEFPAAAAITDNFANPTTTNVMAMGMWWDGAAWDRAPGNSADGLTVNLGTNNDVTTDITQYADGGTQANPTGTVALGLDHNSDEMRAIPVQGLSTAITYGVPTMGVYVTGGTIPTLTDAQVYTPRLNVNAVTMVDGSGVTQPVSITGDLPDTAQGDIALLSSAVKQEDTAHSTADKGIPAWAVRNDAGTALAADGDYIPLITDSAGKLWIRDLTHVSDSVKIGDGTETVNVDASNRLEVVADAGSGLNQIETKLNTSNGHLSTLASSISGTEQQVDVITQPVRDRTTDNVGAGLQTDAIMNDTTALTPKFAVISATTNGNNTIVSASSGFKIRVLACYLVADGDDVDVRWESGAGGTALSGAIPLKESTGYVLPFNPVGWFETDDGDDELLNLEKTGTPNVYGGLTYILVPD